MPLLLLSLTFICVFAVTFGYFIFFVPIMFSNSIPIPISNTTIQSNSGHATTPMISNQWFSSMYHSFPTAPMYALPLAYKFTPQGIEISYPMVQKNKTEITAPFKTDITVSSGTKIDKAKLVSLGDWNIKARLSDASGGNLNLTAGHGMPFMNIESDKNIVVNSASPMTLKTESGAITQAGTFNANTILLTTNSSMYLILLSSNETVTYQKGSLSFPATKSMVIALLDDEKNLDTFTSLRNVKVLDTQSFSTIQEEEYMTEYKVVTDKDQTSLVALYPHQYLNLQDQMKKIGEYRSIRGPLYLYQTNAFTTATEAIVPQTSYQSINNQTLKTQISKDIDEVIQQGKPSAKVYSQGTWFGKVGSLLLLADSQGLQGDKQKLLNYIKPIFYESLKNVKYDKNKSSLIATEPEFGNEELNDHHFHYAYYIRLAAIIGSMDLQSMEKTKNTINEMTKDIATLNKQDQKYPYVRNFDIYESHSWADGFGNSEYGNNQESSSEAINAWYSLYLWGQVTKNNNLTENALYLYNAEIVGAKYYWFDIANLYRGGSYTPAIASQVWGGKVTYSTWFSGETNMKYGINLLPLTPGSEYLGTIENFEKYEEDFIANDGSYVQPWGDLFIAWQAFYDKEKAVENANDIQEREGNTPKSNFLYFLYSNKQRK